MSDSEVVWKVRSFSQPKDEYDFVTPDGFHGWVWSTGTWYAFGKLNGVEVMASGRDGQSGVENALPRLRAGGMVGR